MPRTAKICQSNFKFWPIFSTPAVFEQRLHRVERGAFGNLIGRDRALKQAAIAVAALAVRQRHVAGFVRRQRQRKAAQLRLHRIETRGLGIDGDEALFARALDPGLEAIEGAHGFVFRPIEFLLVRDFEPGRRKPLWRERVGCIFPSPLAGEVGRRSRPGEGQSFGARALTWRGPASLAVLSRNGRG